jgi:hypothetical protein
MDFTDKPELIMNITAEENTEKWNNMTSENSSVPETTTEYAISSKTLVIHKTAVFIFLTVVIVPPILIIFLKLYRYFQKKLRKSPDAEIPSSNLTTTTVLSPNVNTTNVDSYVYNAVPVNDDSLQMSEDDLK